MHQSHPHRPDQELPFPVPPAPRGIDAWASVAAGSWLLVAGLRGHAVLRWSALALGGWLLVRGVSGLSEPKPGRPTPEREPFVDPLDEALDESFPASDPISINPQRPR